MAKRIEKIDEIAAGEMILKDEGPKPVTSLSEMVEQKDRRALIDAAFLVGGRITNLIRQMDDGKEMYGLEVTVDLSQRPPQVFTVWASTSLDGKINQFSIEEIA